MSAVPATVVAPTLTGVGALVPDPLSWKFVRYSMAGDRVLLLPKMATSALLWTRPLTTVPAPLSLSTLPPVVLVAHSAGATWAAAAVYRAQARTAAPRYLSPSRALPKIDGSVDVLPAFWVR